MKPYRIIKSSSLKMNKKKLVGALKPPKVPLWFSSAAHTPSKGEVITLTTGDTGASVSLPDFIQMTSVSLPDFI